MKLLTEALIHHSEGYVTVRVCLDADRLDLGRVRFSLSLRNVEDLLHERGADVSHETVRFW
jgi:hemolysin activation/secretion protein